MSELKEVFRAINAEQEISSRLLIRAVKAETLLAEQTVRLESLSIKWNKRGKSVAKWDEALEELEETFK